MTVDHFLIEVQKEDNVSKEDDRAIIDSLTEYSTSKHLKQGLTFESFFKYLVADTNPPLSLSLGVHHDMPSVIQLDLWPNDTRFNIEAYNRRTLTTPVSLIKCLKSIKEHPFAKSPYPVIVTLEDHLIPDLQAKVGKVLTKMFGEMLYYPESECLQEFPSPEFLKYRIFISTKTLKEYLESKHPKDKGDASPVEWDSSEEEAFGIESVDLTAELEGGDRNDNDQDDDESDADDHKSGHLGAPEYKRLIAIHAGKPKKRLKESLEIGIDKVRRLSLSEQALVKAAASYGTDVVRFTQKNILRVYPKRTRVSSSNFKPLIGWMHGAQMVAFNMQGYDKSLSLMHGMFRSNGGCGYVVKPDFLIKKGPNDVVFDPKGVLIVRKTLKVQHDMTRVIQLDLWPNDIRFNIEAYNGRATTLLVVKNRLSSYFEVFNPMNSSTTVVAIPGWKRFRLLAYDFKGWLLMLTRKRIDFLNIRTRQRVVIPHGPWDPRQRKRAAFIGNPDEGNAVVVLIELGTPSYVSKFKQESGRWEQFTIDIESPRVLALKLVDDRVYWVDDQCCLYMASEQYGAQILEDLTNLLDDGFTLHTVSIVEEEVGKLLVIAIGGNMDISRFRVSHVGIVEKVNEDWDRMTTVYMVGGSNGKAFLASGWERNKIFSTSGGLDNKECMMVQVNPENPPNRSSTIKTCSNDRCLCGFAWVRYDIV